MVYPMRPALCLAALFAAQPALAQALPPLPGEQPLRCTVEPIIPALLYTAPEIAAGFTFSIPLNRYKDGRPEHGWSIEASFTDSAGTTGTTYLTGHIDPPAPHRDTLSGSWTYWVGMGTYSVHLAIFDDTGGICRTTWTVTAGKWPKPGQGELYTTTVGEVYVAPGFPGFDFRTQALVRGLKLRLGTSDGIVRAPSRPKIPTSSPGQPTPQSVTLLMQAPTDTRDQLAIVDAAEVLLARIGAPSVRMVVFSLPAGRELFRQEHFQLSQFAQVRESFASLQYRAVTVKELQSESPTAPANLLNSLIQQEIRESPQSDAVIFLGMEPYGESSFIRLSPAPQRPLPRFSYVHLLPAAPISSQPIAYNLVPWVVRKLNGKILNVNFDKEFDQAVDKLRSITPAPRIDTPPKAP